MLKPQFSSQLLVKELTGYNADVVCLQEVDRKVFESDLRPVMAERGFAGSLCLKGGQVSEGAACFYRKSRFELRRERRLILSEELQNDPLFSEVRTPL